MKQIHIIVTLHYYKMLSKQKTTYNEPKQLPLCEWTAKDIKERGVSIAFNTLRVGEKYTIVKYGVCIGMVETNSGRITKIYDIDDSFRVPVWYMHDDGLERSINEMRYDEYARYSAFHEMFTEAPHHMCGSKKYRYIAIIKSWSMYDPEMLRKMISVLGLKDTVATAMSSQYSDHAFERRRHMLKVRQKQI
jgi:hypothetical protein